MNGNGDRNPYVTWKSLVIVGITVVGMPVFVTWVLLSSAKADLHQRLEKVEAELIEIRSILLQNSIQRSQPWTEKKSESDNVGS